jgi:PAS domain S-box-containing protein
VVHRIRPDTFFEKLLAATPDAIVIVDVSGKITVVNDLALALFGYAREEMIGLAVEALIPERFRSKHPGHRAGYGAAPRPRPMGTPHMPLFGLRKDGSEFHAEISLSPVTMEDGTWAITAVRDISHQVEQQAALRRANEAAEAANRELEAFSYSVAHDLRAPLRSIDGFSQALLEDYGDRLDEDGHAHLHRVRAAAQRMAQLIDDLLGLSRVTRIELHRTEVDISAMATEIADRLQKGQAARSVRFSIQPGLRAWGDARLLGVALENLMANAWKFTARRSDALVEVGSREADGAAAFFVRDNGAGFDMQYAGKLFSAFQRLHAKAEFDGTGIGLATVQRIVRRHGGRIWAEGAVNQGATFWFTLPES